MRRKIILCLPMLNEYQIKTNLLMIICTNKEKLHNASRILLFHFTIDSLIICLKESSDFIGAWDYWQSHKPSYISYLYPQSRKSLFYTFIYKNINVMMRPKLSNYFPSAYISQHSSLRGYSNTFQIFLVRFKIWTNILGTVEG